MIVFVMTVRLRVPWVHSLKEKRMEVKSLLAKLKNHFNVSAIEAGEQDIHQIIQLGFALAVNKQAEGDQITERILSFIEFNSEAEIFDICKEVR